MRRYITVCLSVACFAAVVDAQSKLDLSAQMLVQNNEQAMAGFNRKLLDSRISQTRFSRAGSDVAMVGVVVKFKSGYSVDDIYSFESAEVVSSVDDMAVISLPVNELESLASLDCVETVSAGSMCKPEMYFARPAGMVSEVQAGSDLPQSYTGNGVVVGLMDQGVDPNHINFTDGDDYSRSRVKAVYVYNGSDGIATESAITPEDIKKFKTDNTTSSHGTHVTGIAAGSYMGLSDYGLNGDDFENRPMPYYGIATQSDIVMTAGTLYDANILAGVEEVIKYAESVGKPAAVNLSLGGILGPHDGSDVMSQYLSKLGSRAIISVAAGNEGDEACAMKMSGGLSSSQFSNNAVGINVSKNADAPYVMQFWSKDNSVLALDFVLYNLGSKKISYVLEIPDLNGKSISVGGSATDGSYQKNTIFDNAFTDDSYATFWSQVEDNNRYCVQMQCVLNRDDNSNNLIVPAVRVTRKSGQAVYGYIYTSGDNDKGTFIKQSGTDWEGLNWRSTTCSPDGSISDMATGSNIISVGAYTSSEVFTTSDGTRYSYNGYTPEGTICAFSSYGSNPVTGETYPFISAPGSAIVSSLNSFCTSGERISGTAGGNGRSNRWGPMQGTSMACPFVTGTMALWLEADPTLTVAEARDIIAATAVPVNGDSSLKMKWGHGKLDALAGIKEVLRRKAEAGIDGVVADAGGFVVTPVGNRGYSVMVDGAAEVTARLYNMQGVAVATARAHGNEVTIEAPGSVAGVYILAVESPNAARITRRVLLR